MPCYHPVVAYRSRSGRNKSGAWPIVFNVNDGYSDLKVEIACGQCIGCRLEYSRQWAIRAMHESQLHDESCFLTLTYRDEYLPDGESLDIKEMQRFLKRLRKWADPERFRYIQCGEYGDRGRPHYHACIFGIDFRDKKVAFVENGNKYYNSEQLDKIWKKGYAVISDVTFESAAYVARYVMKKVTGEAADEHYNGREPEFMTASRRPALGKGWIDKYHEEVYPADEIIIRKMKRCKPPRYYDNVMQELDDILMKKIKHKRRNAVKDVNLEAAEAIKRKQIERLKREI